MFSQVLVLVDSIHYFWAWGEAGHHGGRTSEEKAAQRMGVGKQRERLKTELQRTHTLSERAPLTYFFQSVPSIHYPLVTVSGS